MWDSWNALEKLLLRQAFREGAGGIFPGLNKLEKRLKKEILLPPKGFFSYCDSWIVSTWQKGCSSEVQERDLEPSDRSFPIIFLFLSLFFLCLFIPSFSHSFFSSFLHSFVLQVLTGTLKHLYYCRKFPLPLFHISGGRLRWVSH